MNVALGSQPPYAAVNGTSFSAPVTAGACALLFQCRGATATSDDLKRVLTSTAGTSGIAVPSKSFGFGRLLMDSACAAPPVDIDVWLRDDASDTGVEPFTGPVFWGCPDVEILNASGNPVWNPMYSPNQPLQQPHSRHGPERGDAVSAQR